MITIQSILLIVLGILCASLVVLLVAPAYWKRAVRLTTKQLKETLPISEAEMRAQMDRIRAEYAMRVHRLETQKKESKLAATRRLIEINRRDASISSLDSDLEQMKASLEENQNARRVLEQTVADRLPKVEQRLAEAKHLLFNRDKEITAAREATNVVKRAFEEATQINEQQSAQINRLNMSLATRAAKRSPDPREAGFEVELALRSEVEAMRAKTRDQSALISRMQRQIGQSFGGKGDAARELGRELDQGGQANAGVLSAAAHSGAVEAADAEMSELKDSLVDAQNALQNAARGVTGDDMATREFEATIRKLTAANQDQSGEIARLRAALATFEGTNETGNRTIRDSKLALKARLNAVQVQAEQQSAVIAQLRAQLAAAHERTALQGQHFKTEMRRLGAGTMPAAGMARRAANITRPSSLAERIAQPHDDDNDDVSGKSSASAGAGTGTGAGDKDADDARAANGAGQADRSGSAGRTGRTGRTGSASVVAALDSQNGASDDSPAEVKLADEKDANDALTNGEDLAGKSLNVAASDLSDKVKVAAANIAKTDADAGQSDNGTFAATPIVAPVDEGAALAGTAAAPLTESIPETTSAEALTGQTGADDDGLSVMERMARNKKSKWKSSSTSSATSRASTPAAAAAPAPTTPTTSTANDAAAPLMARLEGKEAAAPGEQNDAPKSSSKISGPRVLVKPKIADRARKASDEAQQNADGADNAASEPAPEAKATVGVPARRRAKPRLLERLTGMAKGS